DRRAPRRRRQSGRWRPEPSSPHLPRILSKDRISHHRGPGTDRSVGYRLRRLMRRIVRRERGVDESLAAAYAACRALHRHHGRTYFLATRLLPRWKRRHVHALYGFTRYADEIVDRAGDTTPARRAEDLRLWGEHF